MQEKPDNQNVASDSLRKVKRSLNDKLKGWGRPPEGENWILLNPRVGYSLSTSCDWRIDGALRYDLTHRQSGWSFWIDSAKMAEITPDEENKLPSHRRRDNRCRDDEGE
jgi:hypothetical protein